MVALNFALQPEALAVLHDALICLAKFSDAVSIEARRDKLSLTALNSSKSAYASFAFDASKFFSSYSFAPAAANVDGRFTCRIYNKALLSVFKGRILDPRGGDTTVDRTEQLDIYAENGRVTYTSFTEKIKVLKQPLQTAVSLSTADFEHFAAAEQMHVIISVKDFKAIVTHAGHLRASIHAYYSQPTRPLQFSYSNASIGVLCEFTLMTIGDPQGQANSRSSTPRMISTRSTTASRAQPTAAQSTPSAASRQRTTAMPPPAAPVSRSSARQRRAPPGSATKPSQQESQSHEDANSLFVPRDYGDDDAHWDPAGYGDDDEDTLGWDASADPKAFNPVFRDSGPTTAGTMVRNDIGDTGSDELAPTQRLSQIRGLW
ncbi:DNA repair protein Rad9 [Lasiodiplodia theobromae]|uniref:DNA repair protein Rad9 n=1 Tax=Lasiodiplodia theobromae TaxID=45133 RepID=UPI0015C3BD49|nr:DNA repair protein Rad9 [Lasiodiplodia theobromae]KAF4544982.1 DNA repair protein Rad9 [Lasiodiplodia theobromae]